ncbi:DUF2961 domain-containing protein [Frischella sp. Ac48]|uniref:DUF2961 domain-containing protein n=1 Tax=Frischella japonica TaxID=2741544 RepID=A0ABR7R016_9GAMM|nr:MULTISPECIES: glycoside hydrolase family 172 protein [Frischella]MBC9131803.1 DUF2961 domain-containing protein [Frischella japonica]MBX4132671.1 DUF2961 domain-containing protein [Frischella sp. Ac48]
MNLLSSVTTFQHEQTRTISPENMTGEKGKSCMAASHLGPSRKGSGYIRIKSGESVTIADIKGPAEIRHIWFTLTDKTVRGSFVLRDVVIRIYWDDEQVPSVESPIGDFFCNGFGARCDINSLPIVVNPTGGFNSYFRMPFNKSAKIVITNEHEADLEHFFFTVNYALMPQPFVEPLYFHAQWRRQRVTNPGVDYVIIDNVKGHGYYVGTYLALTALERYWWGEGEFKFYLDGDSDYPTQNSTGSEDYFGGAWAFHHRDDKGRASAQCFQTLFVGYPWQTNRDHTRDYFQTGDANPVHGFGDDALPMHGLYRWHLPDPIAFHEDLKVTFQQIGNDDIRLYERQDDIATVAYWYQNPTQNHNPVFPNQQQRLPR